MYPANATTNSAYGVTDFQRIRRVLSRMEKIGMTFLIHGEEADPDIDVFDREAVFIERRLIPMVRDFPGLRIVLEHVSSREGVDFVRANAPQVGGTITPYHLMLTRTDWLGYGNRPYMYCMPVIKRREDRDALRKAATSGESNFFLGTDSAPHPVAKKLNVVGAAGLFNSPVAIESYAQVFAEEQALDRLEAFTSLNGPKHYRLPPNTETITLERSVWTAPEAVRIDGPEERALVHRGGETIPWKVVAH
jgi:dihydroorotase